MATKVQQASPPTRVGSRPLERQVRVSESGQFTVSMDAVRQLPSFGHDVRCVTRIREKLQSKR